MSQNHDNKIRDFLMNLSDSFRFSIIVKEDVVNLQKVKQLISLM